jgi:cytidyltransferase-like protein
MKTVIVSGGFDPLHSGHIACFKMARALGNRLIVALNSDDWLTRKKGAVFMPWHERAAIVSNLVMVDQVIDFDDSDGSSRNAIITVRKMYPDDNILFVNGGDRTANNIPEMNVRDDNLDFIFGVGGSHKLNSSSNILQEWKNPQTLRPWGYYRVLHQVGPGVKVKELTVEPKSCLSMQRHQHRQELWFVAQGQGTLYRLNQQTQEREVESYMTANQMVTISLNQWHQLCNESEGPLKIIEIQFGTHCIEEDIERA